MTDSIYREIILDHYKNPRNKGTLDPHDYSAEDVNPLCGDEVRIDLRVKDGVVSDVKFQGRGCAVSQASASILSDELIGKPIAEVAALTHHDMMEWLGVEIGPARLKCALLGLRGVKLALAQAGIEVTSYVDEDPV